MGCSALTQKNLRDVFVTVIRSLYNNKYIP